jgi:hypothetical protein
MRRSAIRCFRKRISHCWLKTWLEAELARVSAKSVIASAIRHGLEHWDGLVRFRESRWRSV